MAVVGGRVLGEGPAQVRRPKKSKWMQGLTAAGTSLLGSAAEMKQMQMMEALLNRESEDSEELCRFRASPAGGDQPVVWNPITKECESVGASNADQGGGSGPYFVGPPRPLDVRRPQ